MLAPGLRSHAARLRHIVLLPALLGALALEARAQAVRESTWVTDGTVNAIASTGSTVFIGGDFTQVGPWVGNAANADRASGVILKPYPRVAGTVYATVPDGAGGWYIGGSFIAVRGSPRTNLAHLLADGSVSAWNPGTDGTVRALELVGGVVYVGGDFLAAAGQARHHVAALDAATGAPTSLAPDISDPVLSLTISGATLYASGAFTRVNGRAAPGIAAFDLPAGALSAVQPYGRRHGVPIDALAHDDTRIYIGGGAYGYLGPPTGSASCLDPASGAALGPYLDVDGLVRAVASDGAGGWYMGGSFSSISGQPRQNLAHVLSDGSLAPWAPSPNATVWALAIGAGTVYAGGEFTSCGGQPRSRLAAIDAASGSALGWNPAPDSNVYALLLSGSTLWVGGSIRNIAGLQQQGLAAFDAASGSPATPQPWQVLGDVRALAANATSVFAGGTFAHTGPSIANVARLDAAGSPLGTQLGANDIVYCAIDDGAGGLFLGGDFTTMQGHPQTKVAHLLAGGTLASWAPVMDGSVRTLARRGNTLFIGGSFTSVGGQPRHSLAAVDATTGAVLPFPAGTGTGEFVHSMALLGDTLYLGGSFHTLAGVARAELAAVNAVTGALTSWDPHASYAPSPGTSEVRGLTVAAGTIYAIGRFTQIGAAGRSHLAAIDPVTGVATSWNPSANTTNLGCIAAAGDTIFIGGDFSNVSLQSRSQLAAIDRVSGGLLPWNPSPSSTPWSLNVRGGQLYVGASFSAPTPRGAAVFDLATLTPTAFAPVMYGNYGNISNAYTVMPYAGGVLAGGPFTVAGGVDRVDAAAFQKSTGAALPFDPGLNGPVRALAVTGDTVYMGGAFTASAGATRLRLAAWNSLGLLAWDPEANGNVFALAILGSTVYVGGEFGGLGGSPLPRSYAGAVDAASGVVTAWDPSPNGSVEALAAAGGRVFAGGTFSGIGGAMRGSIAALDPATGAPVAWAPDLSGPVHTILPSAGVIYVGGGQLSSGPSFRTGLAAFDAATGSIKAWNPVLDQGVSKSSYVSAMAMTADTLYIGGDFTKVGAVNRLHVAALGAPLGTASAAPPLAFTLDTDGPIRALGVDGGRLFVGGAFGASSMQPRTNLAAMDALTGEPRSLSPQLNGSVSALALDGARLLTGGSFTLLNGVLQQRFAALDTTTGSPLTGDLQCDGSPRVIVPFGDRIYIGGGFFNFGGVPRNQIAALDRGSLALTAWNPNANSAVNALVIADGLVYAGGRFTSMGGAPRRALAAIDTATGLATAWNPNPTGGYSTTSVNALALDGNSLYVGGNFTSIGGQSRSMLAGLDRTSGAATSWNPGADGAVNVLVLSNGTLFAGGAFTSLAGGVVRQRVAAFDAASGAILGWAPGADGPVNTLVLSGGTAFFGGAFTQFASESRRGFASLADPSFNPLLDVTPHPEGPLGFALAQNTPNPFRGASVIPFTLPRAGSVRLIVLDPAGRVVRTLLDGATLEAGPHTFRLDTAGLAPGLYWYRLQWEGQSLARRMVAVP